MLAYVHSAAVTGIDAMPIKVEIDIQMKGLPGWNMVGLLETAVKESRDRVTSAIRNAGFHIPNRKTIINLSPASMKKGGTHYDLPIAIGLLSAVDTCNSDMSSRFMIAGELSLTGKVCPIGGVLMMAMAAKERGLDGIIIPAANAWEAQFADVGKVIAVETLVEAVEFLNGGEVPKLPVKRRRAIPDLADLDLSEVRGQPFAKRGMEIAAAGGHNIALKGPPGTGKTMLAERLPSILPPLERSEALEVLRIRSCHGLLKWGCDLPSQRPFRAPHHSASYVGLVGGGVSGTPRMGEISLAHRGVLFLDEMAEFRRDVLEVLRQPMESGLVSIVRAGLNVSYPSRFMLAAAFNPCRCGYLTHPTRPCTCTIADIRRYKAKLSGPLLDRIDLHIEVGPPPHEALIESSTEEKSEMMKKRVLAARGFQKRRYKNPAKCNANLSGREVAETCRIARDERVLLKSAAKSLNLSGRAIHRVLKVSRTIADLAGAENIASEHIAEALQFRPTLDDMV